MFNIIDLALKIRVEFLLIAVLLVSESGISRSSMADIIEVSCSDPGGCFGLIKHAVESASDGSTLQIGPGVYYEKTITIQKDLSIESLDKKAQIRFVEIGPGIFIHLPKGEDPIGVSIKGMRFSSPVPDQFSILYDDNDILPILPAAIVIQNDAQVYEKLKVKIEDISIRGYMGILVGSSSLTLSKSEVNVDSVSIGSAFSELGLFENKLTGGTANALNTRVNVSLLNNQRTTIIQNQIYNPSTFGTDSNLEQWGIALEVQPVLGKTTGDSSILLVDNSIDADVGVVLAGPVNAELNSNRFVNNQKYGLLIFDPSCTTVDGRTFVGTLTGKDNEFQGNTQDICPSNFLLPEGFVKPDTESNE